MDMRIINAVEDKMMGGLVCFADENGSLSTGGNI